MRGARAEDDKEDEKRGEINRITLAFRWLFNHLGYHAINTREPR